MKDRILVVDDEKNYRELISLFLKSEEYEVFEAANGREALELFNSIGPDLVILDVMLPDISGFDTCKRIRETSEVPVLFLSALDDEGYHVVGYRSGADDYIAKPFQPSVFALKVKRILARTKKAESSIIRVAGVTLDESRHQCSIDGEEVELTQKEFSVLLELMKSAGKVLTREYLLNHVWGYDFIGDTRTVDSQIKRLRKKLGPYSDMIKTVVSVGYKVEAPS